jgi:hypothetical protein
MSVTKFAGTVTPAFMRIEKEIRLARAKAFYSKEIKSATTHEQMLGIANEIDSNTYVMDDSTTEAEDVRFELEELMHNTIRIIVTETVGRERK